MFRAKRQYWNLAGMSRRCTFEVNAGRTQSQFPRWPLGACRKWADAGSPNRDKAYQFNWVRQIEPRMGAAGKRPYGPIGYPGPDAP
jgi:hypothetical protein